MKRAIGIYMLLAWLPQAGAQDLFPFHDNGKWGFQDTLEKAVIKPQFDNALPFSEGRAAVSLKNKWGYIDSAGKEVIACTYTEAKKFSNGLAAVMIWKEDQNTEAWGYINAGGKTVIPLQYTYASEFSHGLALVAKRGVEFFIDKSGKKRYDFDGQLYFQEDMAVVKLGGKYGLIDRSGKEIVRPQYEEIYPFKDGKAMAVKDGESFHIDKNGRATRIVCK